MQYIAIYLEAFNSSFGASLTFHLVAKAGSRIGQKSATFHPSFLLSTTVIF